MKSYPGISWLKHILNWIVDLRCQYQPSIETRNLVLCYSGNLVHIGITAQERIVCTHTGCANNRHWPGQWARVSYSKYVILNLLLLKISSLTISRENVVCAHRKLDKQFMMVTNHTFSKENKNSWCSLWKHLVSLCGLVMVSLVSTISSVSKIIQEFQKNSAGELSNIFETLVISC